jgi:hypothetical protein
MRTVALAAISLACGLVAALVFARTLLLGVERGDQPLSGWLYARDGWLWEGATDASLGLRWVNLERRWARSNDPNLELRTMPAWSEPPRDLPAPRGASWRVATLAVGWPWPLLARQWQVDDDGGFPPHPPLDDDGLTLEIAARRFLEPHPSATWTILWSGLVADATVFAVPFVGLLWVGSRRLTRRAASATTTARG